MEVDRILIRRSPVLSVLKLLASILGLSILYSVIVMGFDISQYTLFRGSEVIEIQYDIVFFCAFTIIIILMTFFVMFRWAFDSYEIRSGEIVHQSGFFSHKEEQYSLTNTENIYMTQSLLGRIFKYGTITIYNPLQKTEIRITRIVDPGLQLNLIKGAIIPKGGNKIVPMGG